MTVSNPSTLYAVQLDDAEIGGILSQSVNNGHEVVAEATSGSVFPDQAYIMAGRPSMAFTSKAVQQVLTEIPLAGIDIAGLALGYSHFGYYFADGGGRAAGSAHRQFNAVKGMLVLGNLSCQHGGDAQVVANATITFDGTNDPIEESDSVAVPTGIVNAERFGLGPITIGGITLESVRSLEIDFGIVVRAEGGDGDVFPTTVFIGTTSPIITLRGIDPEWLKAANIPRGGKAGTHANTTIYLRKRKSHSTYFGNGDSEHILFTAAGVAIIDPSQEAAQDSSAETGLRFTCDNDGSNDPIVIAVDQTIS